MYESFIAAYDKAAGDKAIGKDNLDKAAKKEKKSAAVKPSKPGRAALEKADPAERETLVKEASAWVADAQFNAALWWEGLGKPDRAIAAYQRYLTRFKVRKDVPEIAFNIGLIYEKEKKWGDAAKTYESFESTYAKDPRTSSGKLYEAKYRQLLAMKQLKNNAEAEKLQKELVASYARVSAEDKKSDRVKGAYAHARFLGLEPLWKQYTEIRFQKVSSIKADLNAKLKKIQEVEKAYTEVLAIGNGEYGIAALTRVGLAYSDFAQNFIDSPNPKGLDAEQLEMYRSELENRAFPLEEKSIEALEKALSKSYELAVYNEWTIAAQERINKYRPGLYAKVRQVPFRGSEFFATASVVKDSTVAAQDPGVAPPADPKASAPSAAAGHH